MELQKENIKEVRVYSGGIEKVFEVGKDGIVKIIYQYDDDTRKFVYLLFTNEAKDPSDKLSQRFLFAILHKVDYVVIAPTDRFSSAYVYD